MTITATATRTRETVRRELRDADQAARQPIGFDGELRTRLVDSMGEAKVAETESAQAAYVADARDRAAILRAEWDDITRDDCGRCQGTGDYQAPTSHLQRGRPVCFRCGGTGRRTR